jgi:hypothetical protein
MSLGAFDQPIEKHYFDLIALPYTPNILVDPEG